ncbi:MAG: hypothetical protein ACRC62_26540 [Microcoleus sp.]
MRRWQFAVISHKPIATHQTIEGRRKKEEGRRKKEEGRRKKEEGRRKNNCQLSTVNCPHCSIEISVL